MTERSGRRLAEVVGSLSVVTDLAAGLPPGSAQRVAVLAATLADLAGHPPGVRRQCLYLGLLRWSGVTAWSHEAAALHPRGDDHAVARALAGLDGPVRLADGPALWRAFGPDGRWGAVGRILAGRGLGRARARAEAALAMQVGGALDLGPAVEGALAQIHERWDGRGEPAGIEGPALLVPTRVVQTASRVILARALGADPTRELARRRGGELEPAMVDLYLRHAGELDLLFEGGPPGPLVLAAEPTPYLDDEAVDAALAFAAYADAKSPWTLGHSEAVASLAAGAAARVGVQVVDRRALRTAGLLHDLGRCAVPEGIWSHPGRFEAWQRTRAAEHAVWTEHIAGPLGAALASGAHERLDGGGYPHRQGGAVSAPARLLAAADVWVALRSHRPHRPALSIADAGREMEAEVWAGRIDRAAAEAVVAESAEPQEPPELPDALTLLEAQALVMAARGQSAAEAATRLGRPLDELRRATTAAGRKTGCADRAAAAVYVLGAGLAGRVPETPA